MPTVTLYPKANGDSSWSGFAGAASQWQAVKTNDGDTSYASQCWPYGDATGLFRLDALPAGIGAISRIDVVYTIRRSFNNLGSYSTQIKTGGTQYQGSGGIRYFSNTVYINGGDTWTVNPKTGLPWTVADINALQAGAWLSSNFWCTFCTQVYVVVTYTAIALPTTTTQVATAIAAAQANLNGTLVNDGGMACNCGFEWGLTIAYGNTTPTQSRTTGQTFAQTVTGLDPNKTYHFKSFATNANGTSYGSDQSFTTPAVLPLAATVPATDIDPSKAMLNGILADDGGQACDSSFEWGLTADYGNETPWQSGKNAGDAFIQVIASLEPETIYHFRARARNSVGSATGSDIVLRTLKETIEVPGSLFDQSLRLLLEEDP